MKTFQLNQNLNNSRTVSHKLFCSLLVLFFTFLSVLFLGISPATVNLLIKKKGFFSLYKNQSVKDSSEDDYCYSVFEMSFSV